MDGAGGETLQAYHDGELSRLARWRFERVLRRRPDLRAELGRLAELRRELRALDAAAPAPDLWDAIARRLPAAAARRPGAWAAGGALPAAHRPVGPPRGHAHDLVWWWKPIGALTVAVLVALSVAYSGLWGRSPAVVAGGVVRWIDSGPRGVIVLDDDPDITIIWVLDGSAPKTPDRRQT